MQRKERRAYIATLKAKGVSPFALGKLIEDIKPPVTDRGAGWDLLKWLVRLANTDVRQLREGDLLNLQEDLREFFSLGALVQGKYPLPSVAELETAQKTIAKHLHELMEEGRTDIGPFGSTTVALRRPVLGSEGQPVFISMIFPTEPQHYLIQEFAKLLCQYGSLISKCPHCGQIFLKLRTKALYCSRNCQSVAAMRKIRAENVKVTKDRGKKRKKMRGNKHGKTRR